jgi:Uma2 family endonuclease
MAVQSPPTTPTQTESPLLTAEELLAMGDIGPSELIEGRLVLMSPTGHPHGLIESRLDRTLGVFVESHQLGEIYVGEVGIYIRRRPDTIRAADLAFVSKGRLTELSDEGYLNVAPELVVEIMSPDDRWSEVKKKLRDYFSIGVRVVWVIDPASQTVSAYRSLTEVSEHTVEQTLAAEEILPGFTLPIKRLFEE